MNPHGSGTFALIRKVKKHINKTVNSGLFVLFDSSTGTVLNREWQIVVKIFLFD